MLPARDSWRVNTAHVSSFVLISILRGEPRTPPSGENLGVLDYHLKREVTVVSSSVILSCFENILGKGEDCIFGGTPCSKLSP